MARLLQLGKSGTPGQGGAHARRRSFRPRIEHLEARLAPALFIENFSDDLDLTRPGFDGWDANPSTVIPDEMAIPHDVLGTRTAISSEPLLAAPPSGPHYLDVRAGSPYTMDFEASRGQPGGLDPGGEVVAVTVSYSGYGMLTFHGDNGYRVVYGLNFNSWSSVTVTGNSPSESGAEIGAIRRVVATTIEGRFFLDDIAVLVLDAGFSNNPPTANLDAVNTLPGQAVNFDPLANDGDGDRDAIRLVRVESPANGTLASQGGGFTYTPNSGFHGVDQFNYFITDDRGPEVMGTVRITVNTPPPAPVKVFSLPHYYAGSFTFARADLLAGVADADGDALSIVSIWSPSVGSLRENSDGTLIYTPPDPNGLVPDSVQFEFQLSDGFMMGERGVAFIDPANQHPVAFDDSIAELHGREIPDGSRLIGGALAYEDGDGDAVAVTVVNAPTHGSVSFYDYNGHTWFAYVPDGNVLRGSDRFTFRVNDGYGGSSASMEIIVPNEAPVALDGGTRDSTLYGLAHSILGPNGSTTVASSLSYLGSDADDDPLQLMLDNALASRPQHGTVTVTPDGAFTYTPFAGYQEWGEDRFGFRFTDGFATSNVAYFTVRQSLGRFEPASDSFVASPGATLRIPVSVLLANDHFTSGLTAGLYASAIRISDRHFAGDYDTPRRMRRVSDGSIIEPHGEFYDLPVDRSEVLATDAIEIEFSENVTTGVYDFEYEAIYRAPGFRTFEYSELRQGSVLIEVAEFPASDADGVPDPMENHGPSNGDGNGDGISDNQQPYVATFTTGTYTNTPQDRWVTLVSSPGTTLFRVAGASLPQQPPPGVTFPVGFFGFNVTGLQDGETATVTIHPHAALLNPTYYKFGLEPDDRPATTWDDRTTPHWYEFLFDGTTGAEFRDDNGDGLTDRIVLHLQDGGRGDDDRSPNGVITDPGGPAVRSQPPRVESVVVNDGNRQRSMVNSLTVRFDGLANLAAGAFEVLQEGSGRRFIPQVAVSVVDGKTVAVLTFSGAGVIGGSLPDGRYSLVIHANRVQDAVGNRLDGDNDGTAGGDARTAFFRRFGDVNGDAELDGNERLAFLNALGSRAGNARYRWYLDFDGDQQIGVRDLAAWIVAPLLGRR